MKYIESLNDIVNSNEQVIAVFTNLFKEDTEDNYEFKPDGTGFTGYWKIHKASKNAVSNINESNEPSFVIIYLRNNEGNNIYKATISEFEHLDPYVRNVIYFKECQFLGQTLKKWPEFRNDNGQNPVKYIPIGNNINKPEEGKPMSKPQILKQELIKLLEANHNLVLTGAPGTGKTFLAREIAEELTQDIDGTIEFVQFHSSYDYTDFVEGLRPVVSNDPGGAIGFELRDGIFKKFCKRASEDPGQDYVFIIDEINRAEPSRVLGELFFAIDPGYRGIEGKVKTQYANLNDKVMEGLDEGEVGYFYVPENVYIIGTMNDIDRNVDSMDFAMRRRFVWKEILASETAEMLDSTDENNERILTPELAEQAKNRMNNLNNKITEILESTAFHIGAAYFLKLENYNGDFGQLWDLHIKPLLSEYLRGMPDSKDKLKKLKLSYSTAEDIFKQLPDYDKEDGDISDWRDAANFSMGIINEYIDKELPNLDKTCRIEPIHFLKLSKYIKKDNDWDKVWEKNWYNDLLPLLKEYLQGNPEQEEHLKALYQSWEEDRYIPLEEYRKDYK